jgi:3-oxoacyl-[acyl-carrier protein] reductase
MNLGLKGKVAVITGASAGIGKAIALGLAEEGVDLAICARREGPLREAETALRAKGVNVYAATCDVGDAGALDQFLENTKAHFGKVDILINNASAFGFKDDEANWESSFHVDLLASARAARKVIPWMTESGGGNILFISSISGLEASAQPYAGGKSRDHQLLEDSRCASGEKPYSGEYDRTRLDRIRRWTLGRAQG